MTTYLGLLYPQLLPDLLHSNATGNVCQIRTFQHSLTRQQLVRARSMRSQLVRPACNIVRCGVARHYQ
jgi:hypothetical protein